MNLTQPGILAEETKLARYLSFSLDSETDIQATLKALVINTDIENTVVGIGQSLVEFLGKEIEGLDTMAAQAKGGIDIPSTPSVLWCWLRGTDRGEIFHRSRRLEAILAPAFTLSDVIDSFQYDGNRDLSGYEDGTENPEGEAAIETAIIQGSGPGIDGSSFVTVQQWLHDFEAFDAMTTEEQDNSIGRHIKDNEEFESAPESAHVKRSAQESFEPEAFMLRRSMPWVEGQDGGLVFVSFGKSFEAFEAILNRMLGKDDGIRDAIFTFTRPVSGAYFWCPPVKKGRLDLSALGL